MFEKTFVMIKPDGVNRELVPEIMSRFQKKGLKMNRLVMFDTDTADLVEKTKKHYQSLKDMSFYDQLVEHVSKGPLVCIVYSGENAIAAARQVLGATNPLQSQMGTIRGDFCTQTNMNACHASDSAESAIFEIELWFN